MSLLMSREGRRYDTQGSLDLNPLIRLKDALEGAQKNTNRMLTKLDRFEKRLDELHEKMQPIQDTTDRYSKAKENISATLLEVGKTYEYFRITTSCEPVIKQGLQENSHKEYFECLQKLSKAKAFFESHREIKSSTSVLNNIDALLQQGIAACTTELETLLSTAERSVELFEGEYQIVSPLSHQVQEKIKSLCDAFEICKHTGHYRTYQTSRITRLKADLKELEIAHAQQWTLTYNDDPYQRGTHPFKDFFSLAFWLVKSEFQLWGSTLPSSEESLKCFVAICDSAVAELHRVLIPIIATENKTGKNISPLIRQSKMLLLRLDVLETFLQRYDDLRDLCHPDARHESSASLALKDMRQTIVESCVKGVEFMLSNAVSDGFATDLSGAKKNSHDLQDFMACDLHPVTGNMLYCCKELSANTAIYKKMMEFAQVQPGHYVPADIDEVICGVLENLIVALETRAAHYDDQARSKVAHRSILENSKAHSLFEAEDKAAEQCILLARKHLFLINNFFAMLNFSKEKRRELGDDKSSSTSTLKRGRGSINKFQRMVSISEKVESRLNTEMNQFCDTISISLGLSGQDMAEFNAALEKDKSSQHRVLKAKFAIFNTGLDALLAQQGEWRVSSAILRETLSQSLFARLVQTYANFFATYSVVKFSKKHMSEYLKYTPAQFENHLRNFFGRS